MVFDYYLEVLAAMDRIDRTSDHAMRIGAGPTGSRDHEIIKPAPGTEKARDRDAVSLRPVSFDTTPGTRVAPCAVVQVKDEDALTFVKALLDILIEDAMANRGTVETSERLLHDPATQRTKPA
jgi:hypothetical protein